MNGRFKKIVNIFLSYIVLLTLAFSIVGFYFSLTYSSSLSMIGCSVLISACLYLLNVI